MSEYIHELPDRFVHLSMNNDHKRHGTEGFSRAGDMVRDLGAERKTLEGEG